MITIKEVGILAPEHNFIKIFKRIISGIALIAIFYNSIIYAIPPFYLLIIGVGCLMLFEWYKLSKASLSHILLGLLIISPAIISLILVYYKQPVNKWLILIYFIIIWSVDTFAMIGGKTLGGPKLAKNISPNKTISGLITGVISGTIFGMLLSNILKRQLPLMDGILHPGSLMLFILILGINAQISDLFISYFKRKFKVKDSGTIIPGHGGVLDRFDSVILTAPLLLIFTYYQHV